MKVLLVNAGEDIIALSCEPIGLEYLGAYLEQRGVDVRICNMIQHNPKRIVSEWKPDFVGVSATTPVVNSGYRLLDWCRGRGVKTVIGGVHASVLPQEALRHSDWVVVGDGEYAMMDIVNGKTPPGIVYAEYVRDINILPFPARHLVDIEYFHRMSGYDWPFGERRKTATVMTSRGCPMRCTFCLNSKRISPPRYNSVERSLMEIRHIISCYGVKKLYFLDDDLMVPPDRFKRLMLGVAPMEIEWGMATRASSVSEELVLLAKNAGCKYIFIGFESGSQKCLDALRKQTTVEDNQRAADICSKHGVAVLAGVMIGIPGETSKDIRMTIDFIKRNKFFSTGLCLATPMPGTVLWDYAKENDLLPKELNWDNFTIGNPKLGTVPNTAMSYAETMKYFKIIDDLCEKGRARISVKWMWDTFRDYPSAAIKTLWRYRKRLLRYLGRIK